MPFSVNLKENLVGVSVGPTKCQKTFTGNNFFTGDNKNILKDSQELPFTFLFEIKWSVLSSLKIIK